MTRINELATVSRSGMTVEQANEIVRRLIVHSLVGTIVAEDEPLPDLKAYSLRELVNACEMSPTAAPDDRLIAAIYVMQNFQPHPLENAKPIVIGDGRAVIVVKFLWLLGLW